MNEAFTILVTDRNPRVRHLLGRTFQDEGYRVLEAGRGEELCRLIETAPQVDLVIFDPDLTGGGRDLLNRVCLDRPDLPLLIHGFVEDMVKDGPCSRRVFVDKAGGDTEELKAAVAGLLRSLHPGRFERWRRSRLQASPEN